MALVPHDDDDHHLPPFLSQGFVPDGSNPRTHQHLHHVHAMARAEPSQFSGVIPSFYVPENPTEAENHVTDLDPDSVTVQDNFEKLFTDPGVQVSLDTIFNSVIEPETCDNVLRSTSTKTNLGPVDLPPDIRADLSIPPGREYGFPFCQYPAPWLQDLESVDIWNIGDTATVRSLLHADYLDRSQFQIPVIAFDELR